MTPDKIPGKITRKILLGKINDPGKVPGKVMTPEKSPEKQ